MTHDEIEKKKKELYTIVFKTDTEAGKKFDLLLLYVIIFSVLVAILDSLESVQNHFRTLFKILEWIITLFFTIEYILRIYISPQKRKYIFSFYGIIDLLAILPSFVSLFAQGTNYLIVIRAVRLLRVFRILQLTHFMKEGSLLLRSIRYSADKILIFILFVVILVIILGSLMYVVEAPYNHSFSNIPNSIYWAIVTITTVGYGDITPVTTLGRFISSLIMLLGYAFIAVPTGIFSSEIIKQSRKRGIECSKCSNRDHDRDALYCKQCGSQLPKEETDPTV